jgi:hypothetical protein
MTRPRAQSGLANLAVLHGLFESVHYVIPCGLDQTASVAQLAEQLICNQQVAGSTPAASSACPASRRRRTENSTRYRTATPSKPATTKKPLTKQRSRPPHEHCQRAATPGIHTGTQPKHPSLPLLKGWKREGSFPSGQRGQTVNLMDFSFAGSNPALPTVPCAPTRSAQALCAQAQVTRRTSARSGGRSTRV